MLFATSRTRSRLPRSPQEGHAVVVSPANAKPGHAAGRPGPLAAARAARAGLRASGTSTPRPDATRSCSGASAPTNSTRSKCVAGSSRRSRSTRSTCTMTRRVHQYAQRIISTPGKQDGLYWKNADGTDGGPISEAVAKAIEEGYAVDTASAYHGYIFHVLKGQGPAAPLGELDYVISGAMIGGFALIATPAEYGVTGRADIHRQSRRHRVSEGSGPGLGGPRQADRPLQPRQDLEPHERRVGEVSADKPRTLRRQTRWAAPPLGEPAEAM